MTGNDFNLFCVINDVNNVFFFLILLLLLFCLCHRNIQFRIFILYNETINVQMLESRSKAITVKIEPSWVTNSLYARLNCLNQFEVKNLMVYTNMQRLRYWCFTFHSKRIFWYIIVTISGFVRFFNNWSPWLGKLLLFI